MPKLTAEQRALALAKARENRAKKPKAEPRVSMDDEHWGKLAKSEGVRLPQHATALTTAGLTQWLKRLHLTTNDFKTWTGGWGFKRFVAENPFLNLRQAVGYLLELKQQKPQTT